MKNKSFKELVKLNKMEELDIIKEYLKMYGFLIFKGDTKKGKLILEKLNEYTKIINLENKIYKFLDENLLLIQDDKVLDDFMEEVDILNEKTYLYYEKILLNCEYSIGTEYDVVPFKDFNTMLDTDSYMTKAVGLTLSFDDVIEFYHDKDLKKLIPNIKVLDVDENKAMDFFGCFPNVKKRKLVGIKICVPKIRNLKTTLINVHELKHGIDLLPQLGEIYQEKDYEISAKEKEKEFVREYLPKKYKLVK